MKSILKLMLVLTLILPLAAQDKDTAKNSQEQSTKQEQPARKEAMADNAYKLVFNIYELEDGKRINQRDYAMVARTMEGWSTLKIGTRVPIETAKKQGDVEIQYLDVGLEVKCIVREFMGKVQARMEIRSSSFAMPEQGAGSSSALPVVRNTDATLSTFLIPGKPSVVASLDDVNSKKRIQVEVTATKLD
jgi:hypothetical protein